MTAAVRYKEKGTTSRRPTRRRTPRPRQHTRRTRANSTRTFRGPSRANIKLRRRHEPEPARDVPPADDSVDGDRLRGVLQETNVERLPGLSGLCLDLPRQIVETEAGGTSGSRVVITWNFKPSGFTENGGVEHLRDGATAPGHDRRGVQFEPSGGVPTNLACRTINIDNLGNGQVEVTIDVLVGRQRRLGTVG